MRKRTDVNLAHGAARLVKETYISDGSFKDDQEQGFKRKIVKDEVGYFLKDADQNVIAKVKFDHNLNEIVREDPYNYFAEITTSQIRW